MDIKNLCLLQKFDKNNFFSNPYPHLVIEDCLPNEIYNKIYSEYSKVIDCLKKENNFENLNNVRLQLNANKILSMDNLKNTTLKKFIEYHTSDVFFKKVIDLFFNYIDDYYPHISKNILEFSQKDFLSIRHENKIINKKYKFVIDCQPGINTPIIERSSVRGPHVDNPVEIIGGLFYLRDEHDNTFGGDFEIYDSKDNNIFFHKKAEVENTSQITKIKSIPYKKNTCIFFLNSEKSIHGISERDKTSHTRNLVNFIIETYKYEELFLLNRKNNFISKLVKKILR